MTTPIIIIGTIGDDCYVQHCNGDGSSKEMITFITFPEEDEDGKFAMWTQISVPVPYDTELGEKPGLKGKTITITIN